MNCDSVRVNALDAWLDEAMSFWTWPGPLTELFGGSSSSRSVPYPARTLPSASLPGLESTARNPVSTSRFPVGMNVVVSENSGAV
jgi:hypothetical protein